jgi:hypothetical protein
MVGVRFPVEVGISFLRHRVQNGSGAHPASYPMGTGGSSPGGEAAGGVKLTAHLHLVPTSKNAWSYNSTAQYVFMAWWSVNHREKFINKKNVQHGNTWSDDQ